MLGPAVAPSWPLSPGATSSLVLLSGAHSGGGGGYSPDSQAEESESDAGSSETGESAGSSARASCDVLPPAAGASGRLSAASVASSAGRPVGGIRLRSRSRSPPLGWTAGRGRSSSSSPSAARPPVRQLRSRSSSAGHPRLAFAARRASRSSSSGRASPRPVPGPAKAWPKPDPAQAACQISGNLEIQECGNLESNKNEKIQILKIRIRSFQNDGEVWISRTKNSWPYLGPFQAIFSWTYKYKHFVFLQFSWLVQ